jgi:hypothetical protein
MPLSIMILSIMTISVTGLYVTLSINDTRHKSTLPLCCVTMVGVLFAECHYAECCSAAPIAHSLIDVIVYIKRDPGCDKILA